jgi:hypothetical protein
VMVYDGGMKARCRLTLLALLSAVAACGEVHSTAVDAAITETDAAEVLDCGEDPAKIAFNAKAVVAGRAIPAGRLAVFFFQFNDDLAPEPPLVLGADVAFPALAAGAERCMEIPLASIQAPTRDEYLLCQRTCIDLNNPACDCAAARARAAIGFVVVTPDTNGNGMLDGTEITDPAVHGFGFTVIAAAPQAFPLPNDLSMLFFEGIDAGVHPYRVEPGAQFDRLGKHRAGTIYGLDLCEPGDRTCQPRVPNLN